MSIRDRIANVGVSDIIKPVVFTGGMVVGYGLYRAWPYLCGVAQATSQLRQTREANKAAGAASEPEEPNTPDATDADS
jgi:hypothetical protein